jgi:heme exporter protein B
MSIRTTFTQTSAVFRKEIHSEFKTRYALNAVIMFVLTTVSMVVFSTFGEKMTNGLASSILWIILFFSSMTGIAKSFVSEEERGTVLLLQLTTSSTAVFFGKLLFNCLLTVVLFCFAVGLFFLFISHIEILHHGIFWSIVVLGSIATASATTIISAIISKANTKNALFPVLSFPLLLPLILSGVEVMYQAFLGVDFSQAQNSLQIIVAYTVVIVTVSYLLFDFVWKE